MIARLRAVPVRRLIQALKRDGFSYRRAKGSQRVYRHPDGRRVVIHYHHSNDSLPVGTLIKSSTRRTGTKTTQFGWGCCDLFLPDAGPFPVIGPVTSADPRPEHLP